MKALEEWINQLSFAACLAVFTCVSLGAFMALGFYQMLFATLY